MTFGNEQKKTRIHSKKRQSNKQPEPYRECLHKHYAALTLTLIMFLNLKMLLFHFVVLTTTCPWILMNVKHWHIEWRQDFEWAEKTQEYLQSKSKMKTPKFVHMISKLTILPTREGLEGSHQM